MNHEIPDRIGETGRYFPGSQMGFVVMARSDVEHFTPRVEHVVISIGNPGHPPAELPDNPRRIDVLHLGFDDVDDESRKLDVEELIGDGAPLVYFATEHAMLVRDFVLRHRRTASLVVCHCDAGLSRSPAVVAALHRWINGPSDIDDQVRLWIYERLELPETVRWSVNQLVHTVLTSVLSRASSTEV